MQFSDKPATAVAKYTVLVAFLALSLAVTALATGRVAVAMG